MTVSKELNQVLTCSSDKSFTSLQIALEAIVVTGDLENDQYMLQENVKLRGRMSYSDIIIVFDTYWNF